MSHPDDEMPGKGIPRDMSPRAIAARLRIAAELYDFARVFSRAVLLGPVEAATPSVGPEWLPPPGGGRTP